MELIRDESNNYAQLVMDPTKFEKWDPITTEELEACFGFNLLMGLTPRPSVSDFWAKDLAFHHPIIADRISRDRYRDVIRFTHYVDNSTLAAPGTPKHDRLGKIRPLLEHLQERFKSVYNPGREVAVDEAMIKFQGHSSLKQYIKNKPVKRGIKVWVLADSANGYFSRLEVYTGRKGKTPEHGLGARVVMTLTSDFQQRWHRAFFDNFFTSKALLAELEKVKVYGCGTARSDRKGFPVQLKKPQFTNR